MSGGAGPLVPTFHGFVSSSMDGLVLFEACLSGKLHHVPRRPHDRERANLIKSGSIFIYEENASGIKRWTDGVAWSPSRILGNFLIYRELEKPFPPGEKKRAMKRKRQSMPGEPYPRRDSDEQEAPQQAAPLTPPAPVGGEVKPEAPSSEHDKDLERQLIGSLVDSYGFRPDGLVKKTMSISINGISHHMVSYYKVDDVKSGILPRPLTDPRMTNISVRPELYLKQNFRAPVEETEHYAIDGHMHAHPQMMYGGMQGGYAVRPGQYFGGQHYPAMYGIASTASNPYAPMTETAGWGAHQPASSTMAYASNPAYAGQTYESYYGRNPSHPGSAVKAEEQTPTSQPTSYHSQYVPPYQGMQNGSQRTPSVMGSSYHTPVQQQPSTFSAMPGRPQYGASTMPSPSTNGSAQPGYPNPSAQQYAVRSPTQQSYSMQPQPARNGTPAIKSDHSATPVPSMSAPDSHAHLQQTAPVGYRSSSYAVGGAPPPTDLGSMVMSSSASYPHQQPPPPHSQHYAQYGSSVPQTFRATGELSSQAGSHYAH